MKVKQNMSIQPVHHRTTEMGHAHIFPLTIIFSNELGLTFYTFPKYHFAQKQDIQKIYQEKIDYIENKQKPLTKKDQYELSGLKHNINWDPRYHDVCYGTIQDAKYAIEVAIRLNSHDQSEHPPDPTYLCNWQRYYDFESNCIVTTPELAHIIPEIVSRERTPLPKPHYSDFHFDDQYKIEILPGDQIVEKQNILADGDRLIVVTRPVGKPTFSKWATRDAIARFECEPNRVKECFIELIEGLNTSYLIFMGDPEYAPEGGTMILMVYIHQDKLTFAQVGSITLKQKVDKYYETMTEDHTFDNPDERTRANYPILPAMCHLLSTHFKRKIQPFITKEEANYLLIPHTPSRFIGHPCWNLIDENDPEGIHIITARPFIKTITK